MTSYKAPLRELRFLLHDVLDYWSHCARLSNGSEVTPELVDDILTECARFCEQVVAPLDRRGDEHGCSLRDGEVTTPPGFKEAYQQLTRAGWLGLAYPSRWGGQGLPMTLALMVQELLGTASWAFSMYPGLSLGAMNTIHLHGTEEQKRRYLPALTEGRWAGTMCLTEPQCGTDLGQISTRAVPQPDGSYRLTGTKIFISAGEHDLTENIVHVVLARLPEAPRGTRGISLFLVPKRVPAADGASGAHNHITCLSLEHKMGLRGSATCVLQFDGASGTLLGPANKGLECMFMFMNTARIGAAVQGVATAELAYQKALAYAKERRSMRALSGTRDPGHAADALIHHGDVRRMLLTQKAIAEGGRALLYRAALLGDHLTCAIFDGKDADRQRWDGELGVFTPILKGFLTELGHESANLAMQVFGGHGYIREHGVEQLVRDSRISTLYEGTTGIQALDLLGRKVLLLTKGKAVRQVTAQIMAFCARSARRPAMAPYLVRLTRHCAEWNYLTVRLALAARKDRDVISAAAVDFLMYSGYVLLAYVWAMMAEAALRRLEPGAPAGAAGREQDEFYRAKLHTAEFTFEHLLPRARGHARAMLAPARSVMQLPVDHFAFF